MDTPSSVVRMTVFFLGALIANCHGQTASIKIENSHIEFQEKSFERMLFKFNNVSFIATDTSTHSIQLNKGLDKCLAIKGQDTVVFLTKFKPNETYVIEPGCCCADFAIKPRQKPRQGIIVFTNKSKRDLAFNVGDSNIDTVKSNQTKWLPFYESAMCPFKPAIINITELDYYSEKYDFRMGQDYESLKVEQDKFILANTYFHFLHGEKIELFYNDKKKHLELRLAGYLTDQEYETIY
jgi:hypothetical protein